MALFHLSVTQTKRSAGQSAIASAAYRAGERLYSEYYGEYSDYTRKGGVICSDILLPSHAPPEFADRQTLWNAVEKAERGKNAQLAYSFDIALQNEFSLEENIAQMCIRDRDNILGKLSDSRYATLDAQYEKEQSELTAEISVLEKAVKSYEKHEKDADRFIALIDKYENFDKLTIYAVQFQIITIFKYHQKRLGYKNDLMKA